MRRGRIVAALAVPASILLIGQYAASRPREREGDDLRAMLEARAAEATAGFDALVAEAGRAADRALERGATAARAGIPVRLAASFEGAGIVRAGIYETWDGTPVEPSLVPAGGSPAWDIVVRGVRTSLIARTASDAAGRHAVASFALEIAPDPAVTPLIPSPRTREATVRWSFAPPSARPSEPIFTAGPPGHLEVPLRDARGEVVAIVTVEQVAAAHRSARRRATANALAALAFATLAGLALVRRPRAVDGRRVLEIAVGVIAARAALSWGRSLAELLPRPLGSPSLYGRSDAWGLLASPAGLAATALAFFLLARSIARWSTDRGGERRATAILALAPAALAAVWAAIALGGSLAGDARIPVPRLDLLSAAPLALGIAFGLVIAGAAELLAALVAIVRPGVPLRRPSRIATLSATVPVVVLALVALHRDVDRVVDERLRTEYAPLVLEQSARRRLALSAAVADAAAAPDTLRWSVAPQDPALRDDVAFHLWIGSDLFQQGFASSLDLVDARGDRRGHFGFGLPALRGEREDDEPPSANGLPPVVTEDMVPIGASLARVLHADAAIVPPGGAVSGRVVGHVLEDPANLPFLPSNAPYLRALGRGPLGKADGLSDDPDYVLYDADSRVLVSTLHQPPTATAELIRAGRAQEAVDVEAGGARYRALPLEDGGRLHLLLTPARGPLDAFGDGVRLLLISGALVLLLAGVGAAFEPGGARALVDFLRASFHRKLLAALLLASGVPIVGLAFVLRSAIERRGEADLAESAASVVAAAQRVVADYQAGGDEDPELPLPLNDAALAWLRRVVGQEIHLYERGVLAATSKPELFDSALVMRRLPGEVDRAVVREGHPFLVRPERLGAVTLPVAYARADVRGSPRDAVLAVPLVLEQRTFARSVERLVEMLLLGTSALAALLAGSAALLARQVAEPVRRLAAASRRIAGGDYAPRLSSRSRDEMGSLVNDFNRMAGALAEQRADLERRRDYIEAVLRNATTGVVSTDAAGRIVTINPAAAALLEDGGRGPGSGETLAAALGRGARLRPLATALERPPASSVEPPVEVDLGDPADRRRLRVVRVPLPDPGGGEIGSLLLLDDVTSLMRENQLAAWAEMARAIAHEIKNPLTPIRLSAEHVRRLLTDRGVLPSPEIDACLDAIVRQVHDLRDISQAFSTYARIPDLARQRTEPGEFLREVAAPYRAAPPAGVRIEEENGAAPAILIDRRILARAVVNLIGNALEAMPRGGTLRLTARGSVDGSAALLSISDTGAGISPEAQARLFEPYFSTKSGGTGLGLAIVRRVVEAHGGVIEVTTAPEQGTTFTIRIPAAPGR